MMARYSGISILSPFHQLKKMLPVLDPLLQSFRDPRMCSINMFGSIIGTNQRVLAAEGCQHESWLLLRLDMLFSVTYPTHFYILGHNFSTVKATSGYWSLEVVSGVFPH